MLLRLSIAESRLPRRGGDDTPPDTRSQRGVRDPPWKGSLEVSPTHSFYLAGWGAVGMFIIITAFLT